MTTRTRLWVLGAVAALAVLAVAVTGATAKTHHKKAPPTITSAKVTKVHRTLVVSAGHRTLYVLSPETAKHLLCKSSSCLALWPPLLIPAHHKPTASSGVKGKLGTIKRGKKLQVTLRGLPLYEYVGDAGKGDVNGEGLASFGGVWHAVDAKPASSSTTTTTTTSTTPTYPGGY
jgi:predicted lipoprotein with Yx(FWY)xxD motif